VGTTLQQVLRSLVTVNSRAASPIGASYARADPQSATGEIQNGQDRQQDRALSERLLQSEIAGAAVQAIVDLKTVDEHGVTFSVWGMGQFELSAGSTHDVTVSELSSGWSVTAFGDPNQVRYAPEPSGISNAAMTPLPRPNAFRLAMAWLLDFLASPIGILLALLCGLALIVRVAIATLALLRASPSRHRRAFRKARHAHEVPASTPQRERRHSVRRRRSRRRLGTRASQS
jgi:hypothetical protein